MVFGFYFARRLLRVVADVYCTAQAKYDDSDAGSLLSMEWMATLLAGAYTFTAVYPNWTLSFAFLPLYLEVLFHVLTQEDIVRFKRVVASLLFGFLIYFPCIGIFVFGVYFLAFIVDTVKNRKVKKSFLLYGILMFTSVAVAKEL